MDTWLDLHMHTKYSMDGEFEPSDLMNQCAAAGLKAVAVSDHDSVEAIPKARKRACELGLCFFSAIELSCAHLGKNFHLLGYGIDEKEPIFHQIEKNIHQQRLDNSEKMMNAVEQLGIYLDRKYVWTLSHNDVIATVNIARAALEDPRNIDNPILAPYRPGGLRNKSPYVNFGWDYCSQGKPAFVPMTLITLHEAVRHIQNNGGAAVLAHPGANMGQNRDVTESLVAEGIDGIEAYCSYHDTDTSQFYADICRTYKLIATIGSDYHGRAKPNIQLGEYEHPCAQDVFDRLCYLIHERGGSAPTHSLSSKDKILL
ncbi:histidinol phosphatase [Megasphaera cerevisiae DSM 20462]|jgi:predicted metal-dependent phosphoesterase TrpH|uniref:Histidinol phosphatase n=1 Tax=Megasphaera cerevisiae DSM 20462 TaxID=1122219 RepID=A0A0J6WZ03_9FIRM|nr:PHP domain-containing protein [Megasphaera cerevisiae]KMO87884.1 histidinol phosphatase [Megasphaera cerevisiae DSM 20462]SJZ42669.1 hypothetical protein SAMN05660900_00335 [Megasphaera cerevisiae DSM 20462]